MDNKAQGALEYLLLIGGAILVAAIVLSLLGAFTSETKTKTGNRLENFFETTGG